MCTHGTRRILHSYPRQFKLPFVSWTFVCSLCCDFICAGFRVRHFTNFPEQYSGSNYVARSFQKANKYDSNSRNRSGGAKNLIIPEPDRLNCLLRIFDCIIGHQHHVDRAKLSVQGYFEHILQMFKVC